MNLPGYLAAIRSAPNPPIDNPAMKIGEFSEQPTTACRAAAGTSSTIHLSKSCERWARYPLPSPQSPSLGITKAMGGISPRAWRRSLVLCAPPLSVQAQWLPYTPCKRITIGRFGVCAVPAGVWIEISHRCPSALLLRVTRRMPSVSKRGSDISKVLNGEFNGWRYECGLDCGEIAVLYRSKHEFLRHDGCVHRGERDDRVGDLSGCQEVLCGHLARRGVIPKRSVNASRE